MEREQSAIASAPRLLTDANSLEHHNVSPINSTGQDMRILIVNAYYSEFLRWFYAQHPGLEKVSYDEQMCIHDESLSGMADFYPSNLTKLGIEAWNVWVND